MHRAPLSAHNKMAAVKKELLQKPENDVDRRETWIEFPQQFFFLAKMSLKRVLYVGRMCVAEFNVLTENFDSGCSAEQL